MMRPCVTMLRPNGKCLEETLSAQPATTQNSDGPSLLWQHESKLAENTHHVKALRARPQVGRVFEEA
ncbi:hypothetical protein Q7C36_010377 [Tachysurus vachellii]|uniref:Uncharacterized protein n=1 Tax=Tachysurus vachellii TaxID=175792 RepID=A0AA88SRF8_TACVA|nr:hypothetical protein Q7C36_010377 [Tachysurus vachellii]